MDDKYADLRVALDAATPGPWKASEHQWPEQVGYCPLVGRPYSICGMDRKNIAAATSFGTAVYIAACHPETIRALLAERDALAVEAQEQARLLGGGAERELRLMAERDALREALEIARDFVAEALAQERVAYRGYESVSSIADIERYLAQIDAVLAQEES